MSSAISAADTMQEPAKLELGSEQASVRLAAYLARQLNVERVEVVEKSQLSGGAIQENWLLKVCLHAGSERNDQLWVLRTDALSSVSVSMSRAQEYAVLQAVHERGGKVPQPILLCEDRSVIGRAFFIMQALRGTASGHVLSSSAELDGRRRVLTHELGANLAKLHQIRPEPGLLNFLGEPMQDPIRQSLQVYRAYLDSLDSSFPVLIWGLYWAERHAPPALPPCLIHRDYRTGNYMVDAGELTGVLDWEFTNWGDPREDIGWFTARCWRFNRPDRVAGGVGELEDFLQGYRSVRELQLNADELRFWQVMAHLRWAVIALQQAQRHASGQESSLELALTGRLVPNLELEILSLTEAL